MEFIARVWLTILAFAAALGAFWGLIYLFRFHTIPTMVVGGFLMTLWSMVYLHDR